MVGERAFGYIGVVAWMACALVGAVGCSHGPGASEGGAELRQPLTATTIRTFGFESLQDWSPLWSSPQLSLSDVHLEGQKSLALAGGGWMQVVSRTLDKEDPAPNVVGYDIRVASSPVNQWWYGSTQLSIDAPSVGIWGEFLGQVDLTGFPTGQFQRVEFTLPTAIKDKLNGNYGDLTFRIGVNVPSNETAPYLLDRFTFGPVPSTCVPVADDNPCTQDVCVNGVPSNVPVPAGTACDTNADVCDGTGTCDSSTSCQLAAPPIVDDGNPCTTDACDALTGVSHTTKPAGTRCDDADECNGEEICNAFGACLRGPAPEVDDGNPCTDDACAAIGGVTHVPRTAGSACADSNVCNGDETCDGAGVCVAGPTPDVPPSTACLTYACDPVAGVVATPAPSGTACDDSTVCNGAETCNGFGVCTNGSPMVVPPNTPCTSFACDPALGVVSAYLPTGTACANGTVCDGDETCDGAGVCVAGTPPVVPAPTTCTTYSCDAAQGVLASHLPTGAACGDGDVCNGSEQCDGAGTCAPGTPLVVPPNTACTSYACDSTAGVVATNTAAGTACDDATVCNGRETCNGTGVCGSGPPLDVPSATVCTTYACDPLLGIVPSHAPTGTGCPNGTVCDGAEACDGAGTCGSGTPFVVPPSTACATYTCDPVQGVVATPTPAGTACADGDVCNGAEACDGAGACAPGTPLPIPPSTACTTYACDASQGVITTNAAPGTACDNASLCDGQETCDGVGACSTGVAPVVDDGNPCTADSCDPWLGVQHQPVADGTGCDDGSICNGSESCSAGACVARNPINTDDGNDCTLDVCDPGTGEVTHPLAPADTECEPIDACHEEGTCDDAGRCRPGSALAFDDGDPCTVETCDPVEGLTRRECSATDLTVPAVVADTNAWIYSGNSPLQTGVAPDTIARNRGALVSGRVMSELGLPLSGAVVTILDHPELGQTVSQTSGEFTMMVNGGGRLTFQVEKAGFISADRSLNVPWAEAARAEDIVLLQPDPQVTEVDLLDEAEPFHLAQASVAEDEDGVRQATVLIPSNTDATMKLADGSVEPINLMNLRITEFTVGPNGAQAMPAALPPASHYTHAFEINADEAVQANAKSIQFSVPLIYYVHNFLDFPSGTIVPVGSYDREKGQWVPEQNGLVIQVVSITGGLAEVSIDADPQPETPAELAAVGIGPEERARLAALYFPGTSLWRVLIPHFSPWDCNWGASPPPDASPPPPPPRDDDAVEDPTNCSGSIIECQNQVLREELPIAGTSHKLSYSSYLVPGRTDRVEIPVTLSGATVPASLRAIKLSIDVSNGERFSQLFPPLPNQRFTYALPERDKFGRLNQGVLTAQIVVSNVYDAVYQKTDAFGYNGNGIVITGDSARGEIYFDQPFKRPVGGTWDHRRTSSGLGGWSISSHHTYDAAGGVLLRGDGIVQRATAVGLAAYTRPSGADGIAAAPDGSVYTTVDNSVFREQPNAAVTTVISNPAGFSGDNGPAISARINRASTWGKGDIQLGPDGSLYIADSGNFRVRRVSPDGIITTIAGNGQEWLSGPIGDGQPAVSVPLSGPHRLAVGSDGSVYFTDRGQRRVRRVGTDGKISTVAGNGSDTPLPTENAIARGPGDTLSFFGVNVNAGIAVLPDGDLLVGDSRGWIRRYDTGGTVTTVAGVVASSSQPAGPHVEGVAPTSSNAGRPMSIAVAPDGSWYFIKATGGNGTSFLVARVGDGLLTFLAGGGQSGNARPTGAPPRSLRLEHESFESFNQVSYGPAGLYFTDNVGITLVRPATPGISPGDLFIPSEDGKEVYAFDPTGRHLKTRDAITGADKYVFSYTNGLLTGIDDAYGNRTAIARNAAGAPLSITSPDGQTTSLTLDGNGYLRTITDPLGQTATLTHSSTGLLTAYQNVRGHTATFQYDASGRLTQDNDGSGGAKVLSRTPLADGIATTYETVGAGVNNLSVQWLPDGTQRRITTAADGTATTQDRKKDGAFVTTLPDGTKITETQRGDPRFGLNAPIISTSTELPPIPPATQGLIRAETQSTQVTLSNPSDLFSVTAISRQRNVNGRIWLESYDQATKTWTIRSPAGRRSFRILNNKGDLVQIRTGELSNALLAQFLAYDTRGRLSTVSQSTRQSLFSYFASGAAAGYLESARNPLLQTTTFTRDALGRTLSQLDPGSNLTQFAWDPLGNLTGVTPPGRPQHDMSYTPVSLMSEYSPPVLASIPNARTVYEHNLARQLERATRPDGLVTEYDYDPAGRLTDITTPNGTYHRDYYDLVPCTGCAAGSVSRVTSPDGINLNFAYNGQLLTSATWSGAVTGSVGFTHNNDFRVRTQTVTSASGSAPYHFGFDVDQMLTCASPTNCDSPGADALRLTYNTSNGLPTGSTLGTITETITHSNLGELATQIGNVGTTVVFSEDYNPGAMTRDALGRIRRKIETINGATNTWGYTYDLAGRLQTVQLNGAAYESYSYDGNGNRLTVVKPSGTTTATYDDQDRALTFGAWTYTYTPNGELATKSNSGTGESWGFAYDVFGNLKRVDLPNGDVVEYLVDGQNRRVGKKKNGVLLKQWLYRNQLHPVAELDGVGNLVATFVFASGKNSPDLFITGGVTYRVFTDQLGSPRALVNVSTGAVAGVLRHDAWGVVLEDSVSSLMPFGFAGGIYDAETGLTRFGARDFDPSIGRWTSKDPARLSGGVNFYAYAKNDPINFVDYNGRVAIAAGAAFAGPLGWAAIGLGLAIVAIIGTDIIIDNDNGDADCTKISEDPGQNICTYQCPDGSIQTIPRELPQDITDDICPANDVDVCPPTISFGM